MLSFTLILSIIAFQVIRGHNVFNYKPDSLERKYRPFARNEKLFYAQATKDMFTFAYDNYMKHAFPKDELNPILCEGRGPDLANPDNININDVLGNYSLSLIDSLGTLAVLRNISEFHDAVRRVVETVSFNQNSTVQVFEVTIRVLGGLLTAHLLMTDKNQIFGNLKPDWYDNELLELAHDLGNRLLPAFEQSQTGIPLPRVNLLYGVPVGGRTETCTAGAGSLLLEFGVLSRLTGDPIYEIHARKAIKALWSSRNEETGLPGNVIDATTGKWIGTMSGLGAGLDSFYEYLLKSYILFGDPADLDMFKESYQLIKQHMRRGRPYCNSGVGEHPLYVNVNMHSGATATSWVDSLQAAFAGVQVLYGDLQEAICVHALYYSLWRKYGALPERYNWQLRSPDIPFYPLRPELMESTYLLYRATKNPFYLHVGVELLDSLNNFTRAQCGYATIHSVLDKSLEDRMESFFLSETCKYLYLLFDEDNPLNEHLVNYLFSTEGHIIPITKELRETTILEDYDIIVSAAVRIPPKRILDTNDKVAVNKSSTQCTGVSDFDKIVLPLQSRYLSQLNNLIGVSD